MDNIERYVLDAINNKNNEPLADFEGYSPNEMQFVLYDTFNPNSTIQLLKADE